MLTHIKIRLSRIKGLKGLFYVLFSRTGCALPATKVDSFFVMVIIRHHANSRQQMTLKPQVLTDALFEVYLQSDSYLATYLDR